ncbi:hypothetical protein JW756_06190 [Candidatus Woesearchaeota archaeon]|nr:hypothetical protein [Candidatus Woesearchaeota archaeon]
MNLIEQKILNKFKKEPLREISTTEIVREVHPEEYSRILSSINSDISDKKALKQAMRKKGQLHRKILYHLNKLVEENVLKIASVHGKGEKYFSLSIEQGEIVIEKKHKRIVLSKPSISTGLIDEYEAKGIVHKFDQENWVSKLNCILLESTNHTGINKFYDLVYSCFSETNDALGLNNFEHLILNSTPDNLDEILKKMDMDTKDHERLVNLIINVRNISDDQKVLDFIKLFVEIKPKNVFLVFKAEPKEFRAHEKLFKGIISEFNKADMKLNVHNKKVHDAPFIMGRTGVYTLLDNEWKEYENLTRGKVIGLAIANTTITIDINRFFKDEPDANQARELIIRTAKTLLKINGAQKKKADEYFRRIDDLNKPYTRRFFTYSKDYIRFWNYDLKLKSQSHLLELLESVRDDVKKFCSAQQTIYKSCGMPSHFNIVFSSAIKRYSSALSPREYSKATIRKFKDYDSQEINDFINTREALCKIFEGGDRIRFFRSGEFTPDDIIHELAFLMNTYDLPLITYDFKERRGDAKLTSFMH